MPVALFLSDRQLEVFSTATKGKSIEYKTAGRGTVQLTAENWEAIREAIMELHSKKFAIRTKTVEHLEVCYYAQEILSKFRDMEHDLRSLPCANDNRDKNNSSDKDEDDDAPVITDAVTETISKLADSVEKSNKELNDAVTINTPEEENPKTKE